MKRERWVFTDKEIDNPKKCRSDDEFVATIPGISELGVIVYRNGEVSNRWADGTAGISAKVRELAKDSEELYRLKDGIAVDADTWGDVEVTDDGKFIRFVD